MNKVVISVVGVAALSALVVWGCGGGGGGGGGTNRPPVAPEPTCNGLAPQVQASSRPGGGNPGYLIPRSTIERPEDIGVRAHTNHLIRAGSPPGSTGLTPIQVRGAYGVNGTGSGAIAIVDAYNYPTALNDFNTFSTNFGLPTEPSSNATASTNQVFRVVYANGTAPADDSSWSQEMALDIEWAHAMAPGAKIYLVEAASANLTDLMRAVNVAKGLPGVKQVSMSFGASEVDCFFVQFNSRFLKSGVAFFAASGDSAADRDFPAQSYNVVAVGGTTLNVSVLGQWIGETAWASTGCGPSGAEPRPVYQDFLYPTIGQYRGANDIAAVADPNTGVAVFDSFPDNGVSGWFVVGGTSAACPIVAGCVNAAGISAASSKALNTLMYSGLGSGSFHDISGGSAGPFSAVAGYDYPTGIGTPADLSTLGP